MSKLHDLDMTRWREYSDLYTDTLWLLGARDKSSVHQGDYWGNFVPQVPHQIIRRFTSAGDTVLDLFSGMGTTLIECQKLGRHGIGVEISNTVAMASLDRLAQAANPHQVVIRIVVGDARSVRPCLPVDCIILHPPYHDIIRFSDEPGDLSAITNLEDFLQAFREVVANAWVLLKPGRYLALVIGDKYADGELIPLSFRCMAICQDMGFTLKAVNVKDIQGNERGKGRDGNLWRYRALKQGFYIFKHEYVMVFRKPT